ncbi:MAG: hypothetical protein Aureis2KO_02910 [Aureisphaera sp.]
MRATILFGIVSCLFFQGLWAQEEEYSFDGVIKLSDITLYTYKVYFYEENGVIEGYSVTDQDGGYETKSLISGTIDYKTKSFTFHESQILTAKSPIVEDKFCYIHFTGTFRNETEGQHIRGRFDSKYLDGELCINGQIELSNVGPILKKKERPKVDIVGEIKSQSAIKQKQKDLVSKANNVSINTVATNEVLHVFSKDEELSMLIYDEELADNDRIDLSINEIPVLIDYGVTRRSRKVRIKMDRDRVEVKITALTNGIIGKNTIRFDITDSNNLTRTVTNLDVGETATLVFLKQ